MTDIYDFPHEFNTFFKEKEYIPTKDCGTLDLEPLPDFFDYIITVDLTKEGYVLDGSDSDPIPITFIDENNPYEEIQALREMGVLFHVEWQIHTINDDIQWVPVFNLVGAKEESQ